MSEKTRDAIVTLLPDAGAAMLKPYWIAVYTYRSDGMHFREILQNILAHFVMGAEDKYFPSL